MIVIFICLNKNAETMQVVVWLTRLNLIEQGEAIFLDIGHDVHVTDVGILLCQLSQLVEVGGKQTEGIHFPGKPPS